MALRLLLLTILLWPAARLLAAEIASLSELASNHAPPLRLQITSTPAALESLRQDPRRYVEARMKEGATDIENVAIHLKGSTGSFRPIDDKPGLTLNFSKFVSNRTFHGSSKIHLNNSVEDPSYLNEKLGAMIFRKAGIPVPAVHHALVELNGRSLGLYVLKEGFTAEFLSRSFTNANGNLYDTDSGHEITDDMQRDIGSGPNDRSDLKQLAGVLQIQQPNDRWLRLREVLDVDEFISFMATEIIICHRDGYTLAHNNYRLYSPENGRFVFLPHGMDQLFGRPGFPWHPTVAGLLAQLVMSYSEGEKLYRQRMQWLVTNAFDVAALTNEVDQTVAALAPALSRKEAKTLKDSAGDLKARIIQRRRFLLAELSKPLPQPLDFSNGPIVLKNWNAVDRPDGGAIAVEPAPDGTPSLHILAGPTTAASWRQVVLLSPGAYRFEARAMTKAVTRLPFGKHHGTCIRLANQSPLKEQQLLGDHTWTTLAADFNVSAETKSIELLCELRASKGDVWFDQSSLKLTQLPSR